MITTEAWVLHQGEVPGRSALDTGDFRKERFSFSGPDDGELLVEPIFGSWEGNMSHALARSPIDICRQRGEDRVVLGNAGVVRVVSVGPGVAGIAEGDVGVLYGCHDLDPFGYTLTALGYDGRRSIGLLAKQTKIRAHAFVPVPPGSPFSLVQWAAFSLRYFTAWGNWDVAYRAYRLQMDESDDPAPHVLGWGGGCTLAELDLARRYGCKVAMISGSDERLATLSRMGITGFDRRQFPDIHFDGTRYAYDSDYKRRYRASESALLALIHEWTGGRGVAIFIDYIGAPVVRASLKALGRQGVIATAGWKMGMNLRINRAIECIRRHIHVHTHHARRSSCDEAVRFAVETEWMPEVSEIYDWDDIPALAEAARNSAVRSYFPTFAVNPQ